MELRCPECCSPEVSKVEQGARLRCGNCGASFEREEALVSVADAEAEQRPAPPPRELFKLDRDRLASQLSDAEDLIPVISPHSDADELNALADDALAEGVVKRAEEAAYFAVYPMSLADPEPILAVNPGPWNGGDVCEVVAMELRESGHVLVEDADEH